MVLPEWTEDVAVIHQQPHRSGKALPDRVVDAALVVERDKLAEEVRKSGALVRLDRREFALVGVERDPQENEPRVVICPAGLGAADPS